MGLALGRRVSRAFKHALSLGVSSSYKLCFPDTFSTLGFLRVSDSLSSKGYLDQSDSLMVAGYLSSLRLAPHFRVSKVTWHAPSFRVSGFIRLALGLRVSVPNGLAPLSRLSD